MAKGANGDGTADAEIDAQISDALEVSSLPYTSDDGDAQTLLPAGWSWSTDVDGFIRGTRNSDGTYFKVELLDSGGGVIQLPTPLIRCLISVKAQLTEDGGVS